MHWVWCTEVMRGEKVAINLDLVATMSRGRVKNAQNVDVECTSLFYGTLTMAVDRIAYGSTTVLETPEQIFTLPRIEVAPARPIVKAGRK